MENSVNNAINFISSKDDEEEHVLHSRSDSVIFTSYDDANEVVDNLLELLRSIYQENLDVL